MAADEDEPMSYEQLREEHIRWLAAGGWSQYEKDFSAAPIAAFLKTYPRRLDHGRGYFGPRGRIRKWLRRS